MIFFFHTFPSRSSRFFSLQWLGTFFLWSIYIEGSSYQFVLGQHRVISYALSLQHNSPLHLWYLGLDSLHNLQLPSIIWDVLGCLKYLQWTDSWIYQRAMLNQAVGSLGYAEALQKYWLFMCKKLNKAPKGSPTEFLSGINWFYWLGALICPYFAMKCHLKCSEEFMISVKYETILWQMLFWRYSSGGIATKERKIFST